MEALGYVLSIVMGIVLGALGGGGSILTVPIFVYFFKVPAVLATGYSLLIVGATSLLAAWRYHKEQLLDYKIAFIFSIPSVLGVLLARIFILPRLAHTLQLWGMTFSKDQVILIVFSILLCVISFFMFKSKDHQKDQNNPVHQTVFSWFAIAVEGFVVGIVTGFVGAGGGFMIVPALVLLAHIPLRTAIASSLLIISAKSLIGFLGDLSLGISYNYGLLLGVLCLTFIGAFLGTRINNLFSVSTLRKGFAVFIIVMGVFIFLKEFYQPLTTRSLSMSHFQNINDEQAIITAKQLKNILKSNETFTLVDVREKDEYQMNHIKGSVLIPLSDFENNCSVLSKNQPLILYCRSGRRSLLAQQHLQKKGYTNTFNLKGGILAYQAHESKGANDEN